MEQLQACSISGSLHGGSVAKANTRSEGACWSADGSDEHTASVRLRLAPWRATASLLDQVELAWRLRRTSKHTCRCLVGALAAVMSTHLQFASASHRGRAAWSSGGCRATASLLDQVELAWRLRRKGKHTCRCLVGVLAAVMSTHLQSTSAGFLF